jgi:hypothetical protein
LALAIALQILILIINEKLWQEPNALLLQIIGLKYFHREDLR